MPVKCKSLAEKSVSAVICLLSLVQFTSAQVNWTWRNPLPQANTLYSAVWTGERTVAVGSGGTIIVSSDEKTWERRSSGTIADLKSIAWSGDMLVAVGSDDYSRGYILTSKDGLDWKVTKSSIAFLSSVIWTGNNFFLVGLQACSSSPDGITWTDHQVKTEDTTNRVTWLYDVTWTGKIYVTVGVSNQIYTSPDGIAWKSCKWPEGITDLHSVTWTGKLIAAAGSGGTIITSEDGETWTEQNYVGSGMTFYGIRWNGEQLVAVGYDIHGPVSCISTSPDGINWTAMDPGVSTMLLSVTTVNKDLLAVGTGGYMLSSIDGETWTKEIEGYTAELNGAVWAPALSDTSVDQFVAVGEEGTILTSPDGINWTKQESGTDKWLQSVTVTDRFIVAVGYDGVICTSSDGITWKLRSFPYESMMSVVWTGTQVVAAGLRGKIFTSPDGRTWAGQTSGTRADLNSVTWTGEKLVAAGDSGVILTSPDGLTWTKTVSGIKTEINSVHWTGKELAAVGGSSILHSADGITWTSKSLPLSLASSITNCDSLLISAGYEGNLFVSIDNNTWKQMNTNTITWLQSIAYNDSLFVVVGSGGTILTSPKEPNSVVKSNKITKKTSSYRIIISGLVKKDRLRLFLSESDCADIKVFNIRGDCLKSFSNARGYLDAGAFPSGSYIVKALRNGRAEARSFVIH